MGECTYPSGDVVDVFVAEARVCKRVMLFTSEIGFKRLLLEGDSLSIFKKLNLEGENRSIIRPIIYNIRILERHFEEVSYCFVPRAVNRATHTLALEGCRRQLSCF
ncbi:hypothetical protein PVK06_010299 [Gossypium arboreum]|uniref:RNase H type-1 domain-containing protein n=1 Tax=Gossypium arboreum TaxID=29729 RepID=A0ABR0Q6W0_GOSAR|nr:hypothetical protein PVK06_010299 [Gossypium arboreum]